MNASVDNGPLLSWAGILKGFVLIAPALPGVMVFGAAFGAAAAAKGLTLAETTTMSMMVYAGMAQMVALEAWPQAWSWAAVGSIALITAVVNSRMVLMGAAIHPWLKAHHDGFNAVHLFFFTDANWLVGTRYHADGGRDLGVLIGAGMALWVLWTAFTVPGHLAGALVTDPKRFALDLVMPVFFGIMLVPLWRGARAAAPWVVAGLVALAVSKLVSGQLYMLAGAIAGMAFAAFRPDEPSS